MCFIVIIVSVSDEVISRAGHAALRYILLPFPFTVTAMECARENRIIMRVVIISSVYNFCVIDWSSSSSILIVCLENAVSPGFYFVIFFFFCNSRKKTFLPAGHWPPSTPAGRLTNTFYIQYRYDTNTHLYSRLFLRTLRFRRTVWRGYRPEDPAYVYVVHTIHLFVIRCYIDRRETVYHRSSRTLHGYVTRHLNAF